MMPRTGNNMDEQFLKLPLMGILRGVLEDEIDFVVNIAALTNLPAVEITMNTVGADKLIRKMVDAAQGRFRVGAGTVLSMSELRSALDAGASFIVMPTLVEDVTEYCVRHDIPVFPGALTPREIFHAWKAGATMVKVFPANVFGPSYLRDLKGPFADVPLLACGGVTPENIREFFENGAKAAAFGASIFRREWLAKRDAHSISSALTALISKMSHFQ
jgi:2-dehydro-3-deoxyphosphogluconate aldolase/(4S)-4-hydroxy-2-oxoglutarate aldolase